MAKKTQGKASEAALKWRLQNAEDIGYIRGLADAHVESRTFETGAEYRAWLRGWRRGQAELRNQEKQIEKKQMAVERSMPKRYRRVG